jgi:hypothetical protein
MTAVRRFAWMQIIGCARACARRCSDCDTRTLRATSGTDTTWANHPAACRRTVSRLAAPERTNHHVVIPHPSGLRQQTAEITPTHRTCAVPKRCAGPHPGQGLGRAA